jgi:hypothetical protein
MSDRDNPTPTTDDRSHFIALGNRYLEAGYLHAAHGAFAAAHSKDKLIAVGDRFLQCGMPASAKDRRRQGNRKGRNPRHAMRAAYLTAQATTCTTRQETAEKQIIAIIARPSSPYWLVIAA